MAQTPEGRVKDAIKQWLNARGAYWYMVVPNGYSRTGVPDFICCLPAPGFPHGLFVGIEAKAPGKRNNTSTAQKRELKAIDRAKGIALVVDSVSQLDDILGGYFHDCQKGQPCADPAPP